MCKISTLRDSYPARVYQRLYLMNGPGIPICYCEPMIFGKAMDDPSTLIKGQAKHFAGDNNSDT